MGTGAPPALVQEFVNAYFRNGFNDLVSLPPLGNVKPLGHRRVRSGIQRRAEAARSWLWPPPVLARTVNSDGPSWCNCMADLYAYYTTVGAGTAGLPLYDTLTCPPIDQTNSCTYDFFDKSYALFAYHVPLATGQNFTIRNVTGNASDPVLHRVDGARRNHRIGPPGGRGDGT